MMERERDSGGINLLMHPTWCIRYICVRVCLYVGPIVLSAVLRVRSDVCTRGSRSRARGTRAR